MPRTQKSFILERNLVIVLRTVSFFVFICFLFVVHDTGTRLSVAAAAAVTPFFASRPQQQVRTVPSEPKTLVVVGSTPSIVLLTYIVRARPAHPLHVVSGRRRSVSFYCSTTTRVSERHRAFDSVVCVSYPYRNFLILFFVQLYHFSIFFSLFPFPNSIAVDGSPSNILSVRQNAAAASSPVKLLSYALIRLVRRLLNLICYNTIAYFFNFSPFFYTGM